MFFSIGKNIANLAGLIAVLRDNHGALDARHAKVSQRVKHLSEMLPSLSQRVEQLERHARGETGRAAHREATAGIQRRANSGAHTHEIRDHANRPHVHHFSNGLSGFWDHDPFFPPREMFRFRCSPSPVVKGDEVPNKPIDNVNREVLAGLRENNGAKVHTEELRFVVKVDFDLGPDAIDAAAERIRNAINPESKVVVNGTKIEISTDEAVSITSPKIHTVSAGLVEPYRIGEVVRDTKGTRVYLGLGKWKRTPLFDSHNVPPAADLQPEPGAGDPEPLGFVSLDADNVRPPLPSNIHAGVYAAENAQGPDVRKNTYPERRRIIEDQTKALLHYFNSASNSKTDADERRHLDQAIRQAEHIVIGIQQFEINRAK